MTTRPVSLLAALGLLALRPAMAEFEPLADQLDMCRVVIDELAVEVLKFDMRKRGEEDIYETVPAICLALVRSYTAVPSSRAGPRNGPPLLVLERRDDDDESVGGAAADPASYLRVKVECEHFVDRWHPELSELLYKHVQTKTAAEMADEFCPRVVAPPEPAKKKRPAQSGAPDKRPAAERKAAAAAERETLLKEEAEYEHAIRAIDGDGSLRRLLQIEAHTPELMLDETETDKLATAVPAVACEVCNLLVAEALSRAGKLPKGLAGASEDALLEVTDTLCEGDKPFDPDHPGNPPRWARLHEATQSPAEPALRAAKKARKRGGAKQAAVAPWRVRALSPAERKRRRKAQADYEAVVLSTAILVRACRLVLHDAPDDDEPLASVMFGLRALGDRALEAIRAEFCRRSCEAPAVAVAPPAKPKRPKRGKRTSHSNDAGPVTAGTADAEPADAKDEV